MKNDYIIPFNSFRPTNKVENKLDEGLTDVLMGGLEMLGDGFVNTIKQKAIAYVLGYLKIKEKSPLSKLIQEIFEEISVKEYYGIVTGKHTNWEYFIPKISAGVVEFLQRSGFDEIAESLGIESDGYLYNILRESISDRLSKRKDFRSDIEDFLHKIFKDESPAETFKVDDIINSMGSSERRKTISGIDKISKKTGFERIKPGGGDKAESSAVSSYIKNLLKDGGGSFAKALTGN